MKVQLSEYILRGLKRKKGGEKKRSVSSDLPQIFRIVRANFSLCTRAVCPNPGSRVSGLVLATRQPVLCPPGLNRAVLGADPRQRASHNQRHHRPLAHAALLLKRVPGVACAPVTARKRHTRVSDDSAGTLCTRKSSSRHRRQGNNSISCGRETPKSAR